MSDLHGMAAALGGLNGPKLGLFALITVAFAAIGRLVRGVTASGGIAGGIVCFGLMCGTGWPGFVALATVFLLTWAATRVGYQRKLRIGAAEARRGRNAGQIFANLSIACIGAAAFLVTGHHCALLAMTAALAEAADDTVSSELGQALGGTPRLVTTWRAVNAGTNGAVTLIGTLAGFSAALTVVVVCVLTRIITFPEFAICATAGFAGTIADSLLGATLESKGVLGNNGVNFLSTA